jgi:hypothetical protein
MIKQSLLIISAKNSLTNSHFMFCNMVLKGIIYLHPILLQILFLFSVVLDNCANILYFTYFRFLKTNCYHFKTNLYLCKVLHASKQKSYNICFVIFFWPLNVTYKSIKLLSPLVGQIDRKKLIRWRRLQNIYCKTSV